MARVAPRPTRKKTSEKATVDSEMVTSPTRKPKKAARSDDSRSADSTPQRGQHQHARRDDQGQPQEARDQHRDLLQRALAQADARLQHQGEAAFAGEKLVHRLVDEDQRQHQQRGDHRDPDDLVDQECGEDDVADEGGGDDDGHGEPAEHAQRAADGRLGGHVGAERFLGAIVRVLDAPQRIGQQQGQQQGEHPLDGDAHLQGGADRLQGRLRHLAGDEDGRAGEDQPVQALGRRVRHVDSGARMPGPAPGWHRRASAAKATKTSPASSVLTIGSMRSGSRLAPPMPARIRNPAATAGSVLASVRPVATSARRKRVGSAIVDSRASKRGARRARTP